MDITAPGSYRNLDLNYASSSCEMRPEHVVTMAVISVHHVVPGAHSQRAYPVLMELGVKTCYPCYF